MAIISNTATQYGAVGKREDLADVIYNISPTDTPFVTGAGRGAAPTQPLFEWQTDVLSAPDGSNAVLEGDDITSYQAATQPTRVANYCQISRKTGIISGTNEATVKAGRKSEKAYQMSKRGQELKRDIETILLQNQAPVAGNDTTARQTGSILSWIRTNVNKASDGANPGAPAPAPASARTDGTPRAFTETIHKDVIQKVWTSGGNVEGMTVLLGAGNKQVASSFSGVVTKNINQVTDVPATAIAAVDVYVSDFGKLKFVPSRWQRNRDAFYVDFEYVSLRYLRPIQKLDLAKTGDAEKFAMIGEYGLEVKQEAALGLAADLV